MIYKKIFLIILSASLVTTLVAHNFADAAANLNQAVTTLPVNEEWSIMARSAMGQISGQTFLRSNIPNGSATDYEKRILAISSIGENPKTFSSENFVDKLQTFFDGTQIGDSKLLNDDIFGVLALVSAGINDNTVSKSRQFILSHQNSDGGWGFGTNVGSDSNTTAMAVAALTKTGSVPASAFNYLISTQYSSAGYGFIPGQAADGASTAWVIMGLNAANHQVPANAITFLENLQTTNGSFKWKPTDNAGSSLVTAYAVIALSGKGLPIRTFNTPNPTPLTPPPAPQPVPQPTPPPPPPAQAPAPVPAPAPQSIHVTINYPDNKIFDANMNYSADTTALSALRNASSQINLLYTIKQTGLGQFVESIDGYYPSGTRGWQYAVNGIVPNQSASDYILSNQDNLQWFYNEAGGNPY